jgi:aminoglycoside phosphotransferase (APT) family kinase protein
LTSPPPRAYPEQQRDMHGERGRGVENQIDQPAVQNLLRPAALAAYLATAVPGDVGAPLGAMRVRGGHSNETFFVWRGADRWVLRRPPLGDYLPTAHDVAREWRVISALAPTHVPVPQPIHFCADPAIIGAPFYLMTQLDGVVIRRLPEWADAPETCHEIGMALADALADLHAVDWRAAGLGDFGKPDGYLERQVRRWATQLEGARNRDIPELDAVTQWLATHIPQSPPATIVHGDYRLDNVMYADGLPVRVVGVLDWEMSTLGDPLADLGYLLAFWREANEQPPAITAQKEWRLTEAPGFPTRAELADRYAARTGRAIAPQALAFYHALALWKMAILLEGSYKRHLAGVTDDPFFASLTQGVPALAAQALAVTRGA